MAITQITFYPNELQYAGFSPTAEPSITGQNYSCSGAETTGPGYDLVDNKRSAIITLNTNAETAAATIDVDLTTAITSANFILLDNHNLGTANATLTFTHGTGALTMVDVKSGLLGGALVSDSLGGGPDYIIGFDGMTLATFTAVTDNNWEILIDDLAIFDADVTIGEIAIGKSFTPATNPELGDPARAGTLLDGIDILETPAGKRYVNERFAGRKHWNLQWNYVNAANLAEFERIFTHCKKRPLYFSLDSGSATPTVFRARIINDWNYDTIAYGAYSLNMLLEEEL